MLMDKVAGSGNDEFYTPAYAIEPLLKYLQQGSTIWCPFDTEESFYVKILRNAGFRVVYTHIKDGQDFFTVEVPSGVDYIISNPPYSLKTEVLEKLFSLKIPFAMLLGLVGIFESQKRFELFKGNDFEVMYFNRRVSYLESYEAEKTSKNPPFSSVYICHKVLPFPLVFEEIDKTIVKPFFKEETE